jgi:hypothetical protein
MLQIQSEDDRSRAAAAAAKAAEVEQRKVDFEFSRSFVPSHLFMHLNFALIYFLSYPASHSSLQRRALLFDSAFDNDRDGCISALGLSRELCPVTGDGTFQFPHDVELALPVDTKNAAGATAASEAAVAGAHDTLLLLLRCGADVETIDDHGRSPLFRCSISILCMPLLCSWF